MDSPDPQGDPNGDPGAGPRSGRAPGDPLLLHASAVAWHGAGVLILGASGRGKSGLALQLMALGADLVADDRVRIWVAGGSLVADAPDRLRGLIEARGIGLLRAAAAGPVRVVLAVDLDRAETDRLPPVRAFDRLGQSVPLLHKVDTPHFAAAILQYMKAGRTDA